MCSCCWQLTCCSWRCAVVQRLQAKTIYQEHQGVVEVGAAVGREIGHGGGRMGGTASRTAMLHVWRAAAERFPSDSATASKTVSVPSQGVGAWV